MCGILIIHGGISNFWVNLLLVMVITALLGAGLGIPAFRVYGVGASDNPIYFLLVTLAFGELLVRVAISARSAHRRVHRHVGHPLPRPRHTGHHHQLGQLLLPGLGIVASACS